MDTNITKPIHTSSHTVPLDVFMDIARILLHNSLTWKIESINEQKNSLLIQVSSHPNLIRHQNALENIRVILSDYAYYFKGSPNAEVSDTED